MSLIHSARSRPPTRFDSANWIASDPLPRDRTQSRRLHEPGFRVDTIDPITGEDIADVAGHPSIIDGDLTIYFTDEASRRAYVDLPVNHPNPHVPFAPTDEDDRGG